MAAGRITCLLILLLFAAWISFAQGGIPDSNHYMTVPTGKGLLDGDEHAVTTATNKNWLGGRKMVVLGRQMKKLKDVKMSGAFGVLGGTSKYSSTNSKCGNDLGCEQTVSHFSDEVDDHQSGFVAFNADYHAPRRHPPKNN